LATISVLAYKKERNKEKTREQEELLCITPIPPHWRGTIKYKREYEDTFI
jgi:hypothetical protein